MTKQLNKQNYFKKLLQLLFLGFILIPIYGKLFLQPISLAAPKDIKEAYDPTLNRIQSIEDLDTEVKTRLNNDFSDTSKLVNTIDDILRNRFYHGYSEYTLRDNWVAYLCSKLFFYGFKFPVVEDDILHFPMAACSQQGIVFQKMLNKYNIAYETTAINIAENSIGGHYTVSAYYHNSWHFFDSNQEPIKIEGNPSIESLIQDSAFLSMYPNLSKQWLKQKVRMGLISSRDVNKRQGIKMFLFQTLTNFLSSWLWFLSLIVILMLEWKKEGNNLVITRTNLAQKKQYLENA